jgi:hypothetical protein
MAGNRPESIFEEMGVSGRRPPEVFRSGAQVAEGPLTGYSHVLRRAWRSFDRLLGVISVRGRPTVYVQEGEKSDTISFQEQRRFWSHGVAPILVRVTPDFAQVYSGLRTPALVGEDVDGDGRLIRIFKRVTEALELRQFIRSVEAGTVYDTYSDHFDPMESVDARLVQNLRAAREAMSKGSRAPGLPSVHRVLGWFLFTCYLEARGALIGKDFGKLGAGRSASFKAILNLSNLDAVRYALVGLFLRLGRYFRGNLFDDDVARDLKSLRNNDIETLRDLRNGNDIGTSQLSLPFDIYDFAVIPIETISAVYEDFIRAEDSTAQRKKGAFYTPPKLVEFTMDFATEDAADLTGKRVLDPGCGSGVFLVSAFNRIGEAWVRQNERARNATRAQALAMILREQICGIDLSLIACQATCFSLYMAMLDFLDPPEIRRLGRDRLPSLLLREGEKKRQNGPQTVINVDFLSPDLPLDVQSFDLIVGNPPWVARGNLEKQSIAAWVYTHKEEEFPLPARQIACAFMWEVPRFLKTDGRACLLLPAGILLGDQTDDFQAKWFKRFRVEKIAHLSDLRFFLFPGADHPTVAIRCTGGHPQQDDKIEYLTPKASHASMFDNVVTIEPDDRKTLALSQLLLSAQRDDAPVVWLSYNWASPFDKEFLTRLRDLPSLRTLVGEPNEHKRWVKGQGFQPKSKTGELHKPKKPFWKPGYPFLSAKRSFDLLLSLGDTRPVDPAITVLRRAPGERLFQAPLVIFNKGYSNIAFSPFDVVFRHALQAISGPPQDANLLKFLTATLLSPLAAYFVFHLTSKAIYRGNPLLTEVLRMPFPLPEEAPGPEAADAVAAVADIFDRVAKDSRFGRFGHHQLIQDARREVVKHVYAYFDIDPDEEILINDVVTTLQGSSTPGRGSLVPTLATPRANDRRRYAETLLEAMYRWSGQADGRLRARCILAEKAGVAVLTISKARGSGTFEETKSSAELDDVLQRLREIAPERYGSLVYLRNLAVLDNGRMHIVKPLTMRFWLRSAALNDADAAASHLLSKGGQHAG